MIRRHLLQTSYAHVSQEMLAFSLARDADTPDELWLIECYPVITLGLAADPRHILRAGDIPVLQTDRGWEVTYMVPVNSWSFHCWTCGVKAAWFGRR